MFINSDDIAFLDPDFEFQESKVNRGKELSILRKCALEVPNYKYVGNSDFSSCVWPGFKLFDFSFNSSSDVYSRFIPCNFFNIGIKIFSSDELTFKASKLRPSQNQMCASLYYNEKFGELDLSPYLVYMMQQNVDNFYISISGNGTSPNVRRFCRSDFVYSVPQVVSEENVEPRKSYDTLYDYLRDPDGSISNRVIVDAGGSVFSMKLLPSDSVSPPHKIDFEDSLFGGVKGYWVNIVIDVYQFRAFVSDQQSSAFNLFDWGNYTITSLLRGKFLMSAIPDNFVFPSNWKVVKMNVKSVETCHHADCWRCDVSTMYRKFDFRCMGKFDQSKRVGFSSYVNSYIKTPYLPNYMRTEDYDHIYLPCGICPGLGDGRLKRDVCDRLRDISKFNQGIVGVVQLPPSIIGNTVYVTDASYGIRFLKYQAPPLLPIVLNSFSRGSPDLCSCTFGFPCELCSSVDLKSENCVSMLKGQYAYDWDDRFKLFSSSGRQYVDGSGQFKLKYFGSDLIERVTPDVKAELLSNASILLLELFGRLVSSKKIKVKNRPLDTTKMGISSSERRFFGVVSMIRSSICKNTNRNIWFVVQHFFGQFFSCRTIVYSKAMDEFCNLYSTIKEYDESGVLTQEQIISLRQRLGD